MDFPLHPAGGAQILMGEEGSTESSMCAFHIIMLRDISSDSGSEEFSD